MTLDIPFLKAKGTKRNIKRYREHCIKHNCFGTLSFQQYMHQDGLEKYIK